MFISAVMKENLLTCNDRLELLTSAAVMTWTCAIITVDSSSDSHGHALVLLLTSAVIDMDMR